jgi:hypothetical protein
LAPARGPPPPLLSLSVLPGLFPPY